MKVLLRRNISKLGKIGDVVDVEPGYARNYLIPRHLAAPPTKANLQAVEAEKQKYAEELARQKTELQAKAAVLAGKEISIYARANQEGNLYGSVGPAQICATLAAEGIFLEPENIALDSPIQRLDKYDVVVEFAEDAKATIHVWVLPVHDSESDERPAEDAEAAADQTRGDQETVENGEESS
ncbi:MAG TPA: 50S ribosomal protein L9 [Phycisphaerae bacterium]|nr:50S ribosomal protein L9 [Phycisphaerae bacterium]